MICSLTRPSHHRATDLRKAELCISCKEGRGVEVYISDSACLVPPTVYWPKSHAALSCKLDVLDATKSCKLSRHHTGFTLFAWASTNRKKEKKRNRNAYKETEETCNISIKIQTQSAPTECPRYATHPDKVLQPYNRI